MRRRLTPGVRVAVLMAGVGLLAGCAHAPRTTVVLLPDEDGHVGAVTVSDGAGSERIDQAYQAVTIADAKARPSHATPRGETAVNQSYRSLLGAQPGKPLTFTLLFVLDSVELTDESKAQLPQIIHAARSRKPTEITVYGHADASGTDKRNDELSAKRARAVADLLTASDPALGHVEVQYFGSRAPVVPVEGRAREPRNRRVDVEIL